MSQNPSEWGVFDHHIKTWISPPLETEEQARRWACSYSGVRSYEEVFEKTYLEVIRRILLEVTQHPVLDDEDYALQG